MLARIIRTSPEFKRTIHIYPSLPSTCADVPAERTNCPPLPGFNSMLWITVPTGIFVKWKCVTYFNISIWARHNFYTQLLGFLERGCNAFHHLHN